MFGSAIFSKKKKFQNAWSDPKFGQRGKVLVIPMPGGKKRFQNAVLACIVLRKNFRNGVLAHSIATIPLIFGEGYMSIQFLQFVQTHLQVFNDNNIRHKIEHVLFSTSKWHFDQIGKVRYAWSKNVT
jgi:hypothetical protein